MTKQFAFQKIQRNRSAIQLYKCTSIALAYSVNGMCDELFSGTGFPLDEDSRVCGSNLFHLVEDRFEGSASADDPLERAFDAIRSWARDCCIVCHRNLHP